MDNAEILLATYNGEKYISQQIDSILYQTSKNWHLTVSDDGSNDCTNNILSSYIKRYPEKISRMRSGKKFGNAREHFFWLLQNCNADYIFFCDQDDVWKADKVEKTLAVIKKIEAANGRKCPAMVFTDLAVVDASLNYLFDSLMYIQQQNPHITDYRQLLFKNVVNGNTMVINKALAKIARNCTDVRGIVMHDWWIAIVAARFGKIAYLPEQTILYRQHKGNNVGAHNAYSPLFYVHKLLYPKELRKSFAGKAKQAGVFLETFAEFLSCDEKEILRAFSRLNMPSAMRWHYLRFINTFSRKLVFFLAW